MLIFKNVAPYIVRKYEGFSLDLDFLKKIFALGFNVCDVTSIKIHKTNREQIKRGEWGLTAFVLKQILVLATYMHQCYSHIHATTKRHGFIFLVALSSI